MKKTKKIDRKLTIYRVPKSKGCFQVVEIFAKCSKAIFCGKKSDCNKFINSERLKL